MAAMFPLPACALRRLALFVWTAQTTHALVHHAGGGAHTQQALRTEAGVEMYLDLIPGWTKVLSCADTNATDRLLFPAAEIQSLAMGATQVKYCLYGSTTDCVTSVAKSYPIYGIRNGGATSHDWEGGPCNSDCVGRVWSDDSPSTGITLSDDMWATCGVITEGGLTGAANLHDSCNNAAGLHLNVQDGGACCWFDGSCSQGEAEAGVDMYLNVVTAAPTASPTSSPTTSSPTPSPTASPTTASPTSSPTSSPTMELWADMGWDHTACLNAFFVVADQYACQASAITAGHSYYQYTATSTDGTARCYTASSCEEPMSGKSLPWRVYYQFATPSPTMSPTMSPTSASPTASPTGSPTTPVAPTSFGDPHVSNVRGEKFDILSPGDFVYLSIPRVATAAAGSGALLRIVAKVEPLGHLCQERLLFVTGLDLSGQWLLGGQVKSLSLSTTVQAKMEAKALRISVLPVPRASRGNGRSGGIETVARDLNASELAAEFDPSTGLLEVTDYKPKALPGAVNQHVAVLLLKLKLGPTIAKIRMVQQREKNEEGPYQEEQQKAAKGTRRFSNSLWLTITGLEGVLKGQEQGGAAEIGGILGFDDHESATLPPECWNTKQRLSNTVGAGRVHAMVSLGHEHAADDDLS